MDVPLRRNRDFVALWVGQAVSNLGIGVSSFAYPLVAATLSLAVLRSPIAYGVVGAVPFFFVPPLNAVLFGRIGERVPDELQGRATSAAILLGPVGPVAAGALLGAAGAEQAVLVYAALFGVLAAVATLSPALRAEPA